MQPRVLQYVVSVAELGSVTAAAAACHVTQPAISRQIAELERSLGVALFHRTPQGLRLTGPGRVLLPVARDILARVEDGRSLMRSLAEQGAPSLTLACPSTTMAYTVAPFVALGDTPIRNMLEFPPGQVYEQLRNGSADLGINTRVPPAEFAVKAIVAMPLLVQVPPAHPLSGRSDVPIDVLRDETIFVPGQGSAIREAFDVAVVSAGVDVRTIEEAASSTVAQAMAASGRGCAVVIEQPRFGLSAARVLSSAGEEVPVTLHGAWDPTHYAAAEIRRFVTGLASWARHRARDPLAGPGS